MKIKTSSMITVMVILSTITVASTFIIAASRNRINYNYYFISVAFNRDPARAVASFGLPLLAAVTAILFVCKYLWLNQHLKHHAQLRFSRYALISGFVGCLGLVGAGAVSISTNLALHLGLAGVFFTCSLASMFTFTLLYSFVPHDRPTRGIKALRWSLFATGVLAALTLLAFIETQPHWASLAELVTTFALVAYLVTLNHDLKNFTLQLSLVPHYCFLCFTCFLYYNIRILYVVYIVCITYPYIMYIQKCGIHSMYYIYKYNLYDTNKNETRTNKKTKRNLINP